jgi:hypothetical protein
MAGLQIDIYAGIGITWITALVTLVMRVIARRVTRVHWWLDDYFAISAFVRTYFPIAQDYMLIEGRCVDLCDRLLCHPDRM